ncbi:MAG TPA: hypothetical protein ACFYDZ_00260 [Candidatus Brocadiaceae bacterium]
MKNVDFLDYVFTLETLVDDNNCMSLFLKCRHKDYTRSVRCQLMNEELHSFGNAAIYGFMNILKDKLNSILIKEGLLTVNVSKPKVIPIHSKTLYKVEEK